MPRTGDPAYNRACALTGNPTGDPLVHRAALSPLSRTSQGSAFHYKTISMQVCNITTSHSSTPYHIRGELFKLKLYIITPMLLPYQPHSSRPDSCQTLSILSGVSNLLASLGLTGRRVVLGHTLNTQTLTKTDEHQRVLSKFTILCCATFIAVLGRKRVAPPLLDPCCH